MIDREMADEGLTALAVAIASIPERIHDVAVTKPRSLEDYGQAASVVGAAGADVATLAAAMKILVRRAG